MCGRPLAFRQVHKSSFWGYAQLSEPQIYYELERKRIALPQISVRSPTVMEGDSREGPLLTRGLLTRPICMSISQAQAISRQSCKRKTPPAFANGVDAGSPAVLCRGRACPS